MNINSPQIVLYIFAVITSLGLLTETAFILNDPFTNQLSYSMFRNSSNPDFCENW